MCGINGIVTSDYSLQKKIKNLNILLKHRGPDDEGFVAINRSNGRFIQYSGDSSIETVKHNHPHISNLANDGSDLILGHRRLSIIDLSENGHGPMFSENGRYWITYNGEIYNYPELREELLTFGYSFRTSSDTEVILRAYEHWGTECLNKFNGMWAFAIWDNSKKILFLARDRFGIKPLYYTKTGSFFAFSSEIKPLVSLYPVRPNINKHKIPFYLIYGNRLNSHDTYLDKIYSVPSSHYLVLSGSEVSVKRYYDIEAESGKKLSETELQEKLINLLTDSIKLRFRSDVPVGTCLSGGFDSSSIVSLSSAIKQGGLNTFSAVWKEKECDESYYINIVNAKYGCIEHKTYPTEDQFESVFRKLCYFQEIPTEGPGLYPQWFVMQKAGEHVKVLLDGQGGDEVFGGYFQMGAYLRGVLKDRRLGALLSESGNFVQFLNKNGIHSFAGWLFPRQYGYLTRSRLSGKFDIVNKALLNEIPKQSLFFDIEPQKKFGNYLGNLSYHFIRNITIPALLHYEDRSSMAHSIESRVPFLDYRLVELGVNLSSKYLSHRGVTRPLYRKTLRPYLPAEVVNRKDKLGFPVPFSKWSKTSLKPFIIDTLLEKNSSLHDYIDSAILEKNLAEHFNNSKDYSWEIWRLLSLKFFLDLFSRGNSF
ncbi:MAG: asparagine synthase (glutamine-hydrolyzing) [Ignavibacteria bacterium]|nr:asparagine synthase (glutamine-hydrolyzing) [Ignavibacteria bacterium]